MTRHVCARAGLGCPAHGVEYALNQAIISDKNIKRNDVFIPGEYSPVCILQLTMLSACRSTGAMLSRLSLLPRAGQVPRTAFTARTLVTVNTKSAGPQVLGGGQKKVATFTFGRLAPISRAMCSDSSSSQPPQQPQLDNTASQPTPAPSDAGDHEGQLKALQPQPNMRVMHNRRKYRRPYTPADVSMTANFFYGIESVDDVTA